MWGWLARSLLLWGVLHGAGCPAKQEGSGKAPLTASPHSPASRCPSSSGTPRDAHGAGDEPRDLAAGPPGSVLGQSRPRGCRGIGVQPPGGRPEGRGADICLVSCSAQRPAAWARSGGPCAAAAAAMTAAPRRANPSPRGGVPCDRARRGAWGTGARYRGVQPAGRVPKNPWRNEGRRCLPWGRSGPCSRGVLLPHGSQGQRVKICTCHRV